MAVDEEWDHSYTLMSKTYKELEAENKALQSELDRYGASWAVQQRKLESARADLALAQDTIRSLNQGASNWELSWQELNGTVTLLTARLDAVIALCDEPDTCVIDATCRCGEVRAAAAMGTHIPVERVLRALDGTATEKPEGTQWNTRRQ
jgi:hypothetical protein